MFLFEHCYKNVIFETINVTILLFLKEMVVIILHQEKLTYGRESKNISCR